MAFGELPKKDWYGILGAGPSDTLAELKRKYQRLVLLSDLTWNTVSNSGHQDLRNMQYHPDKQSADVSAGEVEARMQRFIEIDRAWKILGNEETKKEYDLQRRDDNCYSLTCRCGGKYSVSKFEAEHVSLDNAQGWYLLHFDNGYPCLDLAQ
ncbi:hypothetical protein EYD10_08504, partial [Varanus komodoensis]